MSYDGIMLPSNLVDLLGWHGEVGVFLRHPRYLCRHQSRVALKSSIKHNTVQCRSIGLRYVY